MNDIVKICKKHGELTENNVRKYKTGSLKCRLCEREINKRSYERNKDKFSPKYAEYREKNKEKINEWARNYRKECNLSEDEKVIKRLIRQSKRKINKDIANKFKITVEEYEAMFVKQNNKCKICGCEETRKSSRSDVKCRLAVDHCHTTGKVRALLCHACNIGLGSFMDSIESLEIAINYLKEHRV